ncbi:hypothetical protein GF373_17740, partial [bacterium]|nr:hypothetical protein [bacterium]
MDPTYRSTIEIEAASVSSDESNIPVALVLDDGRFATVANGGKVENTDLSGGASGSVEVPADYVASPNEDGSAPYDFEFVDYDPATGHIEHWIKITAASSSINTPVHLCYGDDTVITSQENVAGTWGNGYEGVWHLGEGGGTAYDSTSNGNDASDHASATGTTGQIGDGQEFDGSNDYYNAGSDSSLDDIFDGGGTVSVWIHPTSGGENNSGKIFNKKPSGGVATQVWLGNLSGSDMSFLVSQDFSGQYGVWKSANREVTFNVYQHIAVTYNNNSDSNDPTLYYNGSSVSINEDTAPSGSRVSDASVDLYIGNRADQERTFDGYIDELMFSSVARDADWVSTTFENQDDPEPDGNFWAALGAEEEVESDQPYFTYFSQARPVVEADPYFWQTSQTLPVVESDVYFWRMAQTMPVVE